VYGTKESKHDENCVISAMCHDSLAIRFMYSTYVKSPAIFINMKTMESDQNCQKFYDGREIS
jgi:hypothetical protein